MRGQDAIDGRDVALWLDDRLVVIQGLTHNGGGSLIMRTVGVAWLVEPPGRQRKAIKRKLRIQNPMRETLALMK